MNTLLRTKPRTLARRLAVFAAVAAGFGFAASPAGAYTITLAIKGYGHVSETTAAHLLDCTSPQSNPSDTSWSCVAGSPDAAYGWGWIVKLHPEAPAGWTFSGWEDTGTTGSLVQCDADKLPDCQFQIFKNVTLTAHFVDTTPPDTTITDSANSTISGNGLWLAIANRTSARFYFSSSDPGSSFECRLDAGSWTACNTWSTYSTTYYWQGSVSGDPVLGTNAWPIEVQANYPHTFEVRATDPSGNVDPTPAQASWIVGGPPAVITSGPPAMTNDPEATFGVSWGAESASPNVMPGSFSVSGYPAYKCKFDGGAWNWCPGYAYYGEPFQPSFTFPDGPHTLQVRSVGFWTYVWGPVSNTWSWTVDTVAPETTITSGPDTSTSSTSASFGFSANESNVSFQCQLDGGDYVACASPKSYSNLAEGPHTFAVRATDAAGNSSGWASRAWTILGDTTPPTITATLAPAADAAGWNNTDVTVTLNAADEAGGSGGGEITYSATGAKAFADTTVAGGSASVVIDREGATVVSYSARDEAGNTSTVGTLTVKIDKTAPTVGCDAADGAWHGANVTVDCTATDDGSGFANEADAAFGLSTNVPSGEETANAAAPSRQVCDLAGNCATAGPIGGNKVDLKAPTIVIVAPAEASQLVLGGAATASYSCTDGGSGVAACAGPVASGADLDTAAVGARTFTVTARDDVGNTVSSSTGYAVGYAQGGTCKSAPGHQILAPINVDGTSVFKQGSTVPAKFRVCDANGVSIGDAGVVAGFKLVQTIAGAASDVNESVDSNTADSAFRWDPTASQWIFNISTRELAANTTYVYRITLNDGSTIGFRFSLK